MGVKGVHSDRMCIECDSDKRARFERWQRRSDRTMSVRGNSVPVRRDEGSVSVEN